MKHLESGFKRAVNWIEYQSKLTEQPQKRYLDYLIGPSFQGINKLFVLLCENKNDREVHTDFYLSERAIKDCYDRRKKLQLVKEVITQMAVY